MTKQTAEGTGGPDDRERTHDAVVRLRREAITQRMAAIGITFSPEGYTRALADTVPGMDPWSPANPFKAPLFYMNLPYTVIDKQEEPVLLTLVPGGSAEARAFRAAQNSVYGKAPQPSGFMAARARMVLADEDTVRMMGQVITEAQLCDLIMAFADNAITAGTNTPFQRAVHSAVANFGSFE